MMNILHVFRAPVGGLFRHVLDLTQAQIASGHRVGIVADSLTGGTRGNEELHRLQPELALGLTRFPMKRHANPGDIVALRHVMRRVTETQADIVHGHGAKGGAYARLMMGAPRAVRAYTPHGGSLLLGHDTLSGQFYLATERLLMLRGDLFLFESAYSEAVFRRKIGNPRGLARIVHNGVSRAEFEPTTLKPDATDIIFIGELREAKGVDVLIDAIATLHRNGHPITATLVGGGPDQAKLRARSERAGLSRAIRFLPPMPARDAQALGWLMVAPSRAESFPYVVLEAAAAGKPLLTTRVGGIPEIYGPLSDNLITPLDAITLAKAIANALDRPDEAADIAQKLRDRIAALFSVETMAGGVLDAYQTTLEKLQKAGRR
jgi:glycosyltransferase involved in cell wall biosynthesis